MKVLLHINTLNYLLLKKKLSNILKKNSLKYCKDIGTLTVLYLTVVMFGQLALSSGNTIRTLNLCSRSFSSCWHDLIIDHVLVLLLHGAVRYGDDSNHNKLFQNITEVIRVSCVT